jgi:hypothetical protein
MRKLIITMAVMGTAICANAQSTNNIDVKAVVSAGCNLTAGDIVFGNVTEDLEEANAPFKIQCSKGTVLILHGDSKNNYNRPGGPIMFKEGALTINNATSLHYKIGTEEVQSNSDVSILKRPTTEFLYSYYGIPQYDYRMQIKLLGTNEVVFPFKGVIFMSLFNKKIKIIEPGNYSDEYTYYATF